MFDQVSDAVDHNREWLMLLEEMKPWNEARESLIEQLVMAIQEAASTEELGGMNLDSGLAAERILQCLREVRVDRGLEHRDG